MSDDFATYAEVLKVDDSLGLVMGWAIVCNEGGEPYFDKQGDHIPEQSMLEAAADFAKASRVACEQHERTAKGDVVEAGTVVFTWPLTKDIAESFGLQTERTGLMIAMNPDDGMLAKFKSGELTGFSIAGQRLQDEDAPDA